MPPIENNKRPVESHMDHYSFRYNHYNFCVRVSVVLGWGGFFVCFFPFQYLEISKYKKSLFSTNATSKRRHRIATRSSSRNTFRVGITSWRVFRTFLSYWEVGNFPILAQSRLLASRKVPSSHLDMNVALCCLQVLLGSVCVRDLRW